MAYSKDALEVGSYRAQRTSEHVWRIVDPFGVAMYLVVGTQRAALIDTGYGLPGLRACVEQITQLPVVVLLSHGHVDHAMGAAEYGEAYLSEADLPVFRAHGSHAFRIAFAAAAGVTDIQLMDSLPEHRLLPLNDGDAFDLGEVSVRAFALPGHTMGSMAFLIDTDRLMMYGDACGPGTILLEDWSADIATYHAALVRMKDMEDSYDRILRNHGAYESPVTLLDDVIEACEAVLADADDREPMSVQAAALLPGGSATTPIFRACRSVMEDGVERRVDGRHGNVTYRADKAPWYRERENHA